MDRVSGAYKRYTQLISFIVAIAISVVINVDSIRIARGMWEQPTIAERLKVPRESNNGGEEKKKSVDEKATEDAVAVLEENLPVGWTNIQVWVKDKDNKEHWWQTLDWWALLTMLPGWLITAFATLFGAPFWFDSLQNVIRLKGAGPSPQEKKDKSAASA
jgi:hypothetical protein